MGHCEAHFFQTDEARKDTGGTGVVHDSVPSAADLDAVAAEDTMRIATAALPPTPDEIDAEIAFYNNAQACLKTAQQTADDYKQRLIFLADSFGKTPAHAEQSIRLAGRRNTVTVTRGTTVTVNEPAVADLKTYLGDFNNGLFPRLFAVTTKHTLVEGARDLLKKLSLPRRTEEKVLSLFGKCIDIKSKSPSVKVEVIKPEKPAKKPRAGKVAA
jgi:hypothetical protein